MNDSTSAFDDVLKDAEDVYDFNQLLDTLIEHRDVILTIPDDQIQFLKKGLSIVKAKRNAKLKDAGLVASTDIVTYLDYKDAETEGTDTSKVRMKLGPRSGVTVLKMELPDNEI